MLKEIDEKFINIALQLAKKNLGLTAPNPVVACVIVKDGEIISTGTTAPLGRPHAESIAINKVAQSSRLEGATLYVTLEPCCHFGKTGPCVDLIIASKIARVVIATLDPYKQVNGAGIKKLQEANIEVICNILEQQAQEINRGFFKKQKLGLPFVTVKLATSLDGKIAAKNFHSKWITSLKARQFGHVLRSKNEAIMLGANSVKNDNPMLDCRLLGLEDEAHFHKRIIISSNVNFDENLAIFQSAKKIPTMLLTLENQDSKAVEKLQNLGVEIIFCAAKKATNNLEKAKIGIKNALEKIAESGVNSVLVEGGKNLVTQLLQENLVDELFLIQSNKIIGADGIGAVGEMGFLNVENSLQNLKRVDFQAIDDENFVNIYKKI